eukprot:9125471-Alexandrium_andersonii.AAC.1
MGGLVRADGSMRDEVNERAKYMYGDLKRVRGPVYKNSSNTVAVKVSIARSVLHTKLLFNSCTWFGLRDAEWRTLGHAYISPIRSATGHDFTREGQMATDDHVILESD